MKKLVYLFILTVSVSFISCEKSIEKSIDNSTPIKASLEYENAINAINEFGSFISKGKTRSSNIKLSLNTSDVIVFNKNVTRSDSDTQEVDSVLLFNFNMSIDDKKGFAIACANDENGQVLAYVEEGELADTLFNQGLNITLSTLPIIAQSITRCGSMTESQITPEYLASGDYFWDDSENGFAYPMVKTQWNQSAPYNYGTPSSSCRSGYYSAGCGAICVAQAIAYYKKYNTNYDFNALTAQRKITTSSNNTLKNTVSGFVASVGRGINSTYGCSEDGGTSAYFSNIYNFLKTNKYNVTSPEYNNYNSLKLYETLSTNNLVICLGQDVNGFGGHFWILDGHCPSTTRCSPDYVHCNWGWNGSSDGWYINLQTLFSNPISNGYHFKNQVGYMYFNE